MHLYSPGTDEDDEAELSDEPLDVELLDDADEPLDEALSEVDDDPLDEHEPLQLEEYEEPDDDELSEGTI